MKVTFTRCLSTNLNTVPLIDGQEIRCIDTGEMYKDYGTPVRRVKLTDTKKLDKVAFDDHAEDADIHVSEIDRKRWVKSPNETIENIVDIS